MRIAFVHNSKAFLPEVEAYTRYFARLGFECEVVRPEALGKLKPDIAWHFMGMDRQKLPGVITIHEYTSASVPPFAAGKNAIKKLLTVRPDYRLFLNDYVKNKFAFNDDTPFGYRDMGVEQDWLRHEQTVKEYDFIYVGQLRPGFKRVLEKLKGRSVLVVSNERLNYEGVTFMGPLPHQEIQPLIRKARFGINYMPDAEPFNQQTSTKLLEYCACKVPVITSKYDWVMKFEKQFGGKYFYIDKEFSFDDIANFNYQFPDLSGWTWEKQIENSGILQVLR